MIKESFYKRGDGFVSTTTFDNDGILSSDYIIQRILTALNLQSIGASTYQTSISQNGTFLRVRISNHGVNLSTWYAKNKDEVVPLKDSNNVAITILPNRQECKRENIPFPQKIINKTTVNTSKDSKQHIPKSEDFTVEHFCYESWKMDENAINLVIAAIKKYMVSGQYVDPLNQQGNKATHFSDTSNQPPKKIKEAKAIKLTEPELRRVITECVAKVLFEERRHEDHTYHPIGSHKFWSNNGKTKWKSIVTLQNPSSKQCCHIAEDDNCYILFNGSGLEDKNCEMINYIFPEAFKALKTLPLL